MNKMTPFIESPADTGRTWKNLILSHDGATPRYTSYPTAPNFSKDFPVDTYHDWLAGLGAGTSLSIYLHTPFCAQMCWYCGCHTKVTTRYAPVEDYIQLMRREIELTAAQMGQGARVTHIHFGGGSPTMMMPRDFMDVMETLRRTFNVAPDAEVAVEIDPRTASPDKIDAYARAGVTRASLGIQDFNDQVLEAVNRAQPFSTVYRVTEQLRGVGITKINADLMYGLPHQSARAMQRTMDYLRLINPDRVAVFGYAHVPWMKKHMTMIDEKTLPNASERYDLEQIARAELLDAGYKSIGIDHFARADDPLYIAQTRGSLRRNFQGYTTDQADTLVGFGVSSIGKFAGGFVQNYPDMPSYRDAVLGLKLPTMRGYTLSADDRLRADVIERLMCDLSVDLAPICARHGVGMDVFAGAFEKLAPLVAQGIAQVEGSVVRMTPDAYPLTRVVATAFDAYFQETPGRHARTV